MSDLIDREALLNALFADNPKDWFGYIAEFPSAERKGEWLFVHSVSIGEDVHQELYRCSKCHYEIHGQGKPVMVKFCPHCGAEMSDGERREK